jgi:hypothetical protein
MRDILKKVTTGSMIAGAALLVAACGGDTEVNNTNVTDLGNDTMMDMNATDMGVDMNAATDMNATTDMNMTDMNASTDMNATTETDTNAQ